MRTVIILSRYKTFENMNASVITFILLGIILINRSDAKNIFWNEFINDDDDDGFFPRKRTMYTSN